MKPVVNWIEDRTGLVSATRHWFYEDIPASSGWCQVFGSIAVFAFMVQLLTGILLAFNYAPTPGAAYDSVKYIVMEVTGGRLMRQMHHWGASMMIIVVVLHMVQTFLWGAYKKPREANWIVGVVLLLVTLAYGLTGYLLPWDNRAYWGTMVATQMAAKAPGMGPYLTTLLGGESGIGVVTFARFYAIHVLLLPPATLALMMLHIFLVRRHGVAPVPGDESKPKKKFYPQQAFKDTLAIFVCFIALFLMSVVVNVPLERMADPTDSTYIPRPDWYFLFLFQLLTFFHGPLEVVGSIVLPTVAILLLFAVPFIDRGAAMKVTRRATAFGIVLLAGLGWGALTWGAIASNPATLASTFDVTTVQPWQMVKPKALSAGFAGAPTFALEGAKVYQKFRCGACHAVNGEGNTKMGPVLNGLLFRRDRKWVEAHFVDPQRMSPGSTMPRYKFTAADLNNVTSWLLALPPR